jgi:hypothetical protein
VSEEVSERELLIESLPPGADLQRWAELEARVLRRSPDCPPLVTLIELGRGLLPAVRVGEVKRHVDSCRACGAWYQGFTRPPDHPRAASVQGLREQSAPPPAEEEAPPPAPPPGSWERQPVPTPSGTFSSLFMRLGPRELIEVLRPQLGDLLADVGFAPNLDEAFRQFVLGRLDQDASFASAGIPEWLERFAREELGLRSLPCRLSPEDWDSVFLRCALRYLALHPPSDLQKEESIRKEETEGARSFYGKALDSGVSSWRFVGQELEQLASSAGITDVAARALLRKGKSTHRSLRLGLTRKG